MIEVVRRGHTYLCKCVHCDSILRYTKADAHWEFGNQWIICPECKHQISVNPGKDDIKESNIFEDDGK